MKPFVIGVANRFPQRVEERKKRYLGRAPEETSLGRSFNGGENKKGRTDNELLFYMHSVMNIS